MAISKAKRDAIAPLREQPCRLRGADWQRANCIMDQIVAITGRKAKLGGQVCPRVCGYCDYYGHTKQHCLVRSARMQAQLERDQDEWEEAQRRKLERESKPLEWWQSGSQHDLYDKWGVPWYKDPYIGPVVLSPGKDGGEGKWARVRGVLTEKTALQ